MKIQIECTPDEAKALLDIAEALVRVSGFVSRYQEALRSRVKYANDIDPKNFTKGVEHAQQKWFDELNASDIDLDRLEELSQRAYEILNPPKSET